MKETTEKVASLQKLLEVKMVEVEVEKTATGKLIAEVEEQSADAQKEQDAANIQAEAVNKVATEAQATKDAANKELEAAIPAMKAAEDAVNCLDIKGIQVMKTLANPPADVLTVTKAILIMRGEKKNFGWPNAQKMLGNPKQFVDQLKSYDLNNIPDWILNELKPIIDLDSFNF